MLVLRVSDFSPCARCPVAGLYVVAARTCLAGLCGNCYQIENLLVNASYIDLVCPESIFAYRRHSLGPQSIAETLVKTSELFDFGCVRRGTVCVFPSGRAPHVIISSNFRLRRRPIRHCERTCIYFCWHVSLALLWFRIFPSFQSTMAVLYNIISAPACVAGVICGKYKNKWVL